MCCLQGGPCADAVADPLGCWRVRCKGVNHSLLPRLRLGHASEVPHFVWSLWLERKSVVSVGVNGSRSMRDEKPPCVLGSVWV